MNEFSTILEQLDEGDSRAISDLMNVVYGELHKLAEAKVRKEKSDLTLQATDLVNEAYLRLLGDGGTMNWENRAHFFGAASEAMRRILVEHARKKRSIKRGGTSKRVDLTNFMLVSDERQQELLSVHEALDDLECYEKRAAQLVKLRYFIGMEHQEAAEALGISKRVADRLWLVAKAWLFKRMRDNSSQTTEGSDHD